MANPPRLTKASRPHKGDVVITMDADMQDSPDEIPALRKMILEDKYDMVSGWKKVRHDPISKTLPSKFFNWTTARVSKIPLHDFNCGLKAYRNKVIKSIEVYGEMHRYIPVIAKWSGFRRKIGEKVVQHRARKYGVYQVRRPGPRTQRLAGPGIHHLRRQIRQAAYAFLRPPWRHLRPDRLWRNGLPDLQNWTRESSFSLTNKPPFYIALTCVVLGTQLFLTGFMAELISRNSPGRNSYLIEQKLGLDPS
jgi:glycosyltransferase involved in cell wall biosynthesis